MVQRGVIEGWYRGVVQREGGTRERGWYRGGVREREMRQAGCLVLSQLASAACGEILYLTGNNRRGVRTGRGLDKRTGNQALGKRETEGPGTERCEGSGVRRSHERGSGAKRDARRIMQQASSSATGRMAKGRREQERTASA